MNAKRITGVVILIVGIVLIIFSSYNMNRVASAKQSIDRGSKMMGDSRASGAVTGAMKKKASSYDAPLMGVLIGGIILVVVGGSMAVFCKKKR